MDDMKNLTPVISDYKMTTADVDDLYRICDGYEGRNKSLSKENDRLRKQLKDMRTLCGSLLEQIKELER